MCVICYVPKGVKTPSLKTLKEMHEANPHGMGFCTPSLYYRGMSFHAFLLQLEKRDINEPLLMHFRLATHGSVRRGNCHPFYDKRTDVYFAHNGIVNIKPYKDRTDSETVFRAVFYPYILNYGLHSWQLKEAVQRYSGYSRFAFMQGDDVMLFGQYEEMDGCYYSNLRFRWREIERRFWRHDVY